MLDAGFAGGGGLPVDGCGAPGRGIMICSENFGPCEVADDATVTLEQTPDGGMIDGTGQRLVIARDVSLDLSAEYSDTRLPPGQTAVLDYVRPRSPDAILLVMTVRVEPDAFYSRFFQALLESDLGKESRMLIAQALGESNGSVFAIFEERFEIEQSNFPTESLIPP